MRLTQKFMPFGFTANLRRHRGFTLVELMVTISILGILIALAAPSFQSLIERVRIEGYINSLKNDLSFAKTEAIRLGQTVTVCRNSITPGSTVCGTTPTIGWGEGGWNVFVDTNGNGQINGTETRLRAAPKFEGGSAAAIPGNIATILTFSPQGLPNIGANPVCFRICPKAGCDASNPNGRYLTLNRVGRLSVVTQDNLSTIQTACGL